MPRFPQTPNLSVVVPLQGDEKMFEDTVLSVLENRPSACQVVAVHNGNYADPFDLGDEVTFATARSSKLVDLIRDAYSSTSAPLVHVMTSGTKAVSGWVDELTERFEDSDLGATVAKLQDADGNAFGPNGWRDVPGRLADPLSPTTNRLSNGSNRGFFLNGFTIRRRLLGGLLDAVAPAMVDPIAVAYAFGCLINQAGWKMSIAEDHALLINRDVLPDDPSDVDRGICLSAIRHLLLADQPSLGLMELLRTALIGSSSLGEMFGMLRYRTVLPAMRRSIDAECVPTVDEMATILSLTKQGRRLRQAA